MKPQPALQRAVARTPRESDRESDSGSAAPLEELLSYQICILAKLIERASAESRRSCIATRRGMIAR